MNATASGSFPFTWKMGACTSFATSVQKLLERESSGSLLVKPMRLLTMTWTVPPVE